MWTPFALPFLLAASAIPTALGFCGAVPSQDDVAAAQRHLDANKVDGTLRQDASEASFTVPVAFTVFYDQANPSDGNISDNVITQQMTVINSYFNAIGLYFKVSGVRRIAVPYDTLHGVAIGNAGEKAVKQYRQGDVKTLNLYTIGQNSNGNLAGWSSFPWDYQSNPQNDGIIMDYNYLPGGRNTGYNTGKITVHEIGHWAGLLHTFQDGCNGGDQVDDTPAEASAASGCPTGRNTCPAAGNDPIDNMMDYSDDACRVKFTNGQFNRLAQALNQYRGINLY